LTQYGALFCRGRDIQENELVGALVIVALGQRYRIPASNEVPRKREYRDPAAGITSKQGIILLPNNPV